MTQRARSVGLLLWAAMILTVMAVNIVAPSLHLVDGWPWVGGLMAFPIAAVIVLLRRPGNTIGRLLALVASAAGLQFTFAWISAVLPHATWTLYLDALSGTVAIGTFGGILGVFHLFPSGVPITRAHRIFLVALGGTLVLVGLLQLFTPGIMESTGRVNPLGFAPAWVGSAVDGAIVMLPIAAAVGIVVLVARHRRAGAIERAQLRWFFIGAATLTLMFVVFAFVPDALFPLTENVVGVLFLLGFWSLPAAIVIAILRYRLYDIDRVLSRTVSYLIIAGVLTAVYLALVLALQSVLPVGSSQVVVAASTLGAAAVFTPVRRFILARLDRRFDRARYQAAVEAQAFSRRLQREFEPELIQQDLADVITRTMHPSGVQVWLRH